MNFLYRLNTSLHRFYYRHFSQTQHKIVRFMGIEFVVRPDNYIDRRIWIEGGYEKKQLAYLTNQAQQTKCDTFIDIGSNVGLYSCILGTMHPRLSIHSFECDPRNLFRLYGHIQMNQLADRIAVYPFALGDTEKNVTLQLAPEDNTGRSSLIQDDDNAQHIEVEQKPLDNVLALKGQKILIKIDVEGYEEFVLKGMPRLLENNQCLIQMELLEDKPDLTENLASVGYKNIHKIGSDYYFSNFTQD